MKFKFKRQHSNLPEPYTQWERNWGRFLLTCWECYKRDSQSDGLLLWTADRKPIMNTWQGAYICAACARAANLIW